MSDNYYDLFLIKIDKLINEGNIQEATSLIEDELKMPYIPREFESRIISIHKDLITSVMKTTSKLISVEQFEQMLNEDIEKQIAAVEQLKEVNVRNYLSVIKAYLNKQPERLIASLIIDTLIDQNINEEIVYRIDGLSYVFIPVYVVKPVESDGFELASKLIEDEFESNNPSAHLLAQELLLKQCYLHLPNSFEEDDAHLLAATIISLIYEMIGDEENKVRYQSSINLNDERLMKIYSF